MTIPYGRQFISPDDIAAVERVMSSPWLTQGPVVPEFEQAVADKVGARFAVAFTSATAALHGCTAVSEIGPGDTVHTSPITFIASANCARYLGATPALLDIDPGTWNIDPRGIDTSVSVLVAVDFAGLPMEWEGMTSRPRVIIEDAAHALGASTASGPVGNCAVADTTVFSFHPVKPITTGEGGMVTTNDPELAERLREFRSHGIKRVNDPESWEYNAATLGYNYRMTELQAALGLSQLAKLDSFISHRNELADRYRELLADFPVDLPPAAPAGSTHGYHLFVIGVDNRREVFRKLRKAGIGVQVHYVPVHHHTISKDIAVPPEGFPHSDSYYERAISLPIYPDLTEAEQDLVVAALRDAL